MGDRACPPRVGIHERGLWYTLMLLGVLTLAPGTIMEVGLFLLYAKRFISHTKITELDTIPGRL